MTPGEPSAAVESGASRRSATPDLNRQSRAAATGNPVVCIAHVTNQMASIEHDFEKGEHNGATDALAVIAATRAWLQSDPLDTEIHTEQAHDPADERSNSHRTPFRSWSSPAGPV